MSVSEPDNHPLQFVCWVSNVSGGSVISNILQCIGQDIDYNRKLVQVAERAGFDYALMQIRLTAGYGAGNQHESVSFLQALLISTENLKVVTALLPGPWNPILAAKQTVTISHLYGPRIAVNVVGGWFRGEFKAIGEPWLDHEERYPRSEELICCLQGVWRGDSFTFASDFYRFHDYSLKPKPLAPLPETFQGGSSRVARDTAARVSDWYSTNGNTPEGIKVQVDDIRRRAAQNQHQMKIGVNGFVIVRESEKEAQAMLRETIDNANPDAVKGFQHEVKNVGNTSLEDEGNQIKPSFEDLVQYNDGFKTNLIGMPQQIAERIIALKQSGVNLLLLVFLYFQEEVEFFGREMIPRVHKLEKQSQSAIAHVMLEAFKYWCFVSPGCLHSQTKKAPMRKQG